MKPNFALDLSHEGINLLHRSKGGWTLVGSVALDDPEMGAHLHELRRTAAMLESGGITTKLIIPDSQILYTTVDAPGPDDISREVQIRAALDGLTPYPVGELVFDWRADGEQARVAVLARETMDEAEGFAVQYKFNPVSFAARPARGTFSGEPFFGKSRAAAQILGPGERVEPDASPVPLKPRTAAEPQSPGPEPEETSANPPAEDESVATAPITEMADAAPEPDDPFAELDRLAAELSGEAAPEPPKPAPKRRRKPAKDGPRVEAPVLAPFPPTPDEAEDEAMPTPRPIGKKSARGKKPTKAAKPAAPPPATETDDVSSALPPNTIDQPPSPSISDDDAAAPVSFASTRAPTEPGEPSAEPPSDRLTDVSPRIGIADKDDAGSNAAPSPSAIVPPAQADGSNAPIPRAPMVAHDGIRADMAEALAKPLPRPGETEAKTEHKGADTFTRLTSAARGLAGQASAAAAAQRAKRDARKAAAAEAALANTAPEPLKKPETKQEKPRKSLLGPRRERSDADLKREREAEAMTIFGARRTQSTSGRPKYLGLILTLILLLAMAAVAIWSSFLVDGGQTSLFNPGTDTTPVMSEAPAGSATPDTAATTPPESDPQAPAMAEVLTQEAAQARYAATGIWQRAPDVPAEPEITRLEPFDLGGLAKTLSTRSPTALPDVTSGALRDVALADPMPPPPPGTTFDLDENGLVIPTPDGALSPTGILVFSGRPGVVPPPLPAALRPATTPADTPAGDVVDAAVDAAVEAAVAETAATPEPSPPFALPGVPGIRPLPRPANIPPVPAPAEDPTGALTAEPTTTDDNAALIRPSERPDTATATTDTAAIDAAVDDVIEAAFANATELAVPSSLKPSFRPRNFDKLVASAQTNASDGSTVIAAAATVAPAIPTSANVATRATTENALNLRRINLIGIYGSSNARRALVRMSNGRYVKVEIGDRLDGGKVTSISASKLTYQKGSRAYTLEVLPLG